LVEVKNDKYAARAAFNLGFMYKNGIGVEEDQEKSLLYYNLSTEIN